MKRSERINFFEWAKIPENKAKLEKKNNAEIFAFSAWAYQGEIIDKLQDEKERLEKIIDALLKKQKVKE